MCNSSYSCLLIVLKLHRCFGHGLKMCMLFGYNPQIILTPFPGFELCLFSASILTTYEDRRYHLRVIAEAILIDSHSI